jgi:hypothetical protein
MLAATPTPFCILKCSPVSSNQSSLEAVNHVQAASKYPRSNAHGITKKSSTSLLSSLDRRDATVITQSIAAYGYSFSHLYPAFSKAHRAGRLLITSDWSALRVVMLELLQLAREQPAEFYAFSAHGLQPLSCLFNSCLYALGDRLKETNPTADAIDTQDLPDVFSVIAALNDGITAQSLKLTEADAASFCARYRADSLSVAVQREVQMLISRPYAATDSTCVAFSPHCQTFLTLPAGTWAMISSPTKI